MAPTHPAWSRNRKSHHGGAHRNYTQTTPTYGRLSPAKCSECDSLRADVNMPTCQVTESNILAEPCAMPVDSRQLQKPEHENFDFMVEDTLCQEATIEIGCLDEGIPDFDLLDEIVQQSSKWMQSCEQLITLQPQIHLRHSCMCVLVAKYSTDYVHGP